MRPHYIRIYDSWKEETAALTDEEKGKLIDALIDYQVTDQKRVPEGNGRFLYPLMVGRIERDNEVRELRKAERQEARNK